MNNIALKYPVILVHGIGAKDTQFFWGRIPAELKNAGLKVFLGNTDSWGSFESNARSLSKTVDYTLQACECDKVNIIAHSKGGLDSRFLISSLGYAGKVASLTTISTPHRGSEIVDYLFKKRTIYTPAAQIIIHRVMQLYGDQSPEPYKIVAELTTQNMADFNRQNLNMPGIYYNSYHSVMHTAFDDPAYYFSFKYLKKMAGENDGVVSLQSAHWGEDFHLIHGKHKSGISHSEIVDIKKKDISGIDIPGEYLKIVQKLSLKGY